MTTVNDLIRTILGGIAVGCFATTMFEANLIALKALVQLNRCAIEAAWAMTNGLVTKSLEEYEQQQQDNFEPNEDES